jgi:hypothetical protein
MRLSACADVQHGDRAAGLQRGLTSPGRARAEARTALLRRSPAGPSSVSAPSDHCPANDRASALGDRHRIGTGKIDQPAEAVRGVLRPSTRSSSGSPGCCPRFFAVELLAAEPLSGSSASPNADRRPVGDRSLTLGRAITSEPADGLTDFCSGNVTLHSLRTRFDREQSITPVSEGWQASMSCEGDLLRDGTTVGQNPGKP